MNLDDYLKIEGLKEIDLSTEEFETKIEEITPDGKNKFEELYTRIHEPSGRTNLYNFLSQPKIDLIKDNITISQVRATIYYTNMRLVKGNTVLDVGCNNGLKTIFYAINNPEKKIIGIDLSEVALNIAEERAYKHSCKNTEFIKMNLKDMPNSESFERIIADHIFHELASEDFDQEIGAHVLPIMNEESRLIVGLSPQDINSFWQGFESSMYKQNLKLLDRKVSSYYRFKKQKYAYLATYEKAK